MKKIIIIIIALVAFSTGAYAQGGNGNNGNGNNGNGNNWGQNGNGNAYGQGNGNQGNGNNGNNGNGNQGNGNNWGQNGNGNAFGQGNGNNGGGSNGGSNGGGNGAGAGANQVTNLSLNNAIELTFYGTGSTVGADVTLAFANVNDYANGVESAEQELRVRSNKNFSINVKTNASNFSYSGNTNPAPSMPVSGVLALKVTSNTTNGSISNNFSATSYNSLSSSSQSLINGASRGGNRRFTVKYKATPGFAYPAGIYSVDVVYTATQQ